MLKIVEKPLKSLFIHKQFVCINFKHYRSKKLYLNWKN